MKLDRTIYFIMGPSGSGKTTVLKHIIQDYPEIKYLCSYTTRSLRPGEVDGEKYHFITTQMFEQGIVDNKWLEYAHSRNQPYRYGTSRDEIIQHRNNGHSVIKEIDILGLQQVLKTDMASQVVSIFLAISPQEMKYRLTLRGDTPADKIQEIIEIGKQEYQLATQYCDYIIDANQSLEHVIAQVKKALEQKSKSD